MTGLSLTVVRPGALSGLERDAWTAFVGADEARASPFFSLHYALIADEVVPDARVAVVRREGEIVGFLPHQRRGDRLQPLGAPLNDYHGLIARSDAEISLAEVVRGVGGRAFSFSGLVGSAEGARATVRSSMGVDLSDGFDAYYARQRSQWGKHLKDKERAARSMERDHGPPLYTLHDPEALDWLIEQKRWQYRSTGQHDVFACGWTRTLLETLAQADTAFGGRLATLRLGGRLVAAEYGLRSDGCHHFWFPAYNPEFARYSPGSLLTLNTLRLAAEEGVTWGDFGLDAESYKKYYAQPARSVLQGVVEAGGPAGRWDVAAPVAGWRDRAERRLEVIRACETRWSRAALATAGAFWSASVRAVRSRTAAALGGVTPATFSHWQDVSRMFA